MTTTNEIEATFEIASARTDFTTSEKLVILRSKWDYAADQIMSDPRKIWDRTLQIDHGFGTVEGTRSWPKIDGSLNSTDQCTSCEWIKLNAACKIAEHILEQARRESRKLVADELVKINASGVYKRIGSRFSRI